MREFNVDDLIRQGLVKKKTYTEGVYKGLSVLKYSKRVFWDNLWHLDDRLLECRGIVVDEDDNIIVRPFKKVFNVGELNCDIDPDREVIVSEKINGFLGAVTMTKKYGLIVSTTGTLDSQYAVLARKWIEKGEYESFIKDYTYLFEICDDTDPHIVSEVAGAYIIGIRSMCGELVSETGVTLGNLGFQRPIVRKMLYKDIPPTDKEGYIVRCAHTGEPLCKIKSTHYLAKKALMRMGKKRCGVMFNNPDEFRKQIDEEFYELLDFILATYSEQGYNDLTEAGRRKLFEEFFDGK